jgi:molybdopterin-guanine dinucleotide biosynthesis protein A
MGGNKPLYEYDGRPLIAWARSLLTPQVSNVFVNAGRPDTPLASALASLKLDLIFDEARYYELGPLSGVHSALRHAQALGDDLVATIPCDMPRLPKDLVATLMSGIGADIDVVYARCAREYPLCALWRVTLLDELESRLDEARSKGGLSVMRFLASCRSGSVAISNDDAFLNVNAPIGDPG